MTIGFRSPRSRTGLMGDHYVYSASVGTLTTAKRPPRCSAGRGTYVLYSTGLKYYCTVLCCTSDSCTSSKQYVELILSASRGEKTKNDNMVLEYWAFPCLERGRDLFWQKISKHLGKNVSCQPGRFRREQAAWLGA